MMKTQNNTNKPPTEQTPKIINTKKNMTKHVKNISKNAKNKKHYQTNFENKIKHEFKTC